MINKISQKILYIKSGLASVLLAFLIFDKNSHNIVWMTIFYWKKKCKKKKGMIKNVF